MSKSIENNDYNNVGGYRNFSISKAELLVTTVNGLMPSTIIIKIPTTDVSRVLDPALNNKHKLENYKQTNKQANKDK